MSAEVGRPLLQGSAASRSPARSAERMPTSAAGLRRPQLPCGPDPLSGDRMLPAGPPIIDQGGLRTDAVPVNLHFDPGSPAPPSGPRARNGPCLP